MATVANIDARLQSSLIIMFSKMFAPMQFPGNQMMKRQVGGATTKCTASEFLSWCQLVPVHPDELFPVLHELSSLINCVGAAGQVLIVLNGSHENARVDCVLRNTICTNLGSCRRQSITKKIHRIKSKLRVRSTGEFSHHQCVYTLARNMDFVFIGLYPCFAHRETSRGFAIAYWRVQFEPGASG